MIDAWLHKPIQFKYPIATQTLIQELASQQSVCEIKETHSFKIENTYFKNNLPGSLPKVFTRQFVLSRLIKMAELLQPQYGIYIFDAFRTIETQTALFDQFREIIRTKHPELTGAALEHEVRKYVVHPQEPGRFKVPPHNSGGAIDLAIYHLSSGELLDFGSPFDLTENISNTNYFEAPYDASVGMNENRWLMARQNRRILFHLMTAFDFTNYENEWWHYDLGDEAWCSAHQIKPCLNSMEDEVKRIMQDQS